jgi:hypothetical protein
MCTAFAKVPAVGAAKHHHTVVTCSSGFVFELGRVPVIVRNIRVTPFPIIITCWSLTRVRVKQVCQLVTMYFILWTPTATPAKWNP